MEFLKKNIKWITIGACVLTVIGLFLPLISFELEIFGSSMKESIVYIEHDGVFVFAAMVIAGVFILLNKEAIAVAPILVATGLTTYESIKASKNFDSEIYEYASYKIGFDIGFYIIIAGLIIATATILYNLFVVKKMTFSEVVQSVINARNGNFKTDAQTQTQSQVTYAQYGTTNDVNYGYNNSYQQPVQNNYGSQPASMMQTGYNNDFNINNNVPSQPVEMPTANVNANIFNQAPVVQNNVAMNQQQPVDTVMNNMQQVEPVQDFANHVPSMITCPQCRATLNSGMQFCNQCGSKLN